jgi:ParB family chromosome partitioning protein
MSTIEMIPVSNVRLLNPRARNKIKFSEIVKNIAAIGLKKPIIVAPREEEPGTYDLVCGQGRLEAYQALGQTQVPALIRVVAKHDRYIMSLVENLARCQLQPMELVRELARCETEDTHERRDRLEDRRQRGLRLPCSCAWPTTAKSA